MLKTAKILEEKWDSEEIKKREDVVVVMKDYWEWQREQENEIEGWLEIFPYSNCLKDICEGFHCSSELNVCHQHTGYLVIKCP